MQAKSPVAIALESLGVSHSLFAHPGPVTSFEQAAEERGQQPDQIVRSIVFRASEGEYFMVLVAGPQQIAWPALRSVVGQNRISMASQEEVLEVTGYIRGAVSPFGMKQDLPIYVDESVSDFEDISIGSGIKGTTVILKSEDLLEALPDATRVKVRKDD